MGRGKKTPPDQKVERDRRHHSKTQIVEVDGTQVFSADFVFQQIQSQNRRIDLIKALSLISIGVALAAAIATVALLIR